MSRAYIALVIKAMRKKEFYSIERISQGKTLSQYYTILAVLVGKKKDRGGVRKRFADQVKLTAEVKKYVRKYHVTWKVDSAQRICSIEQ
jgi:hypothetical protein